MRLSRPAEGAAVPPFSGKLEALELLDVAFAPRPRPGGPILRPPPRLGVTPVRGTPLRAGRRGERVRCCRRQRLSETRPGAGEMGAWLAGADGRGGFGQAE